MWSNRVWLAVVLLATTPAAAEPVRCPARSNGAALKTVSVFDGTPQEMADLVPDTTRKLGGGGARSAWSVEYVRRAGRSVHVRCEYANGAAPVDLVAPTAKTCVWETRPGKGNSLECR